MRHLSHIPYKSTFILSIVWCFLILQTYGCSDNAPQRAGVESVDTATGEKENQQQVEEYVAKMLPLLQEHGFPHITMTLVDENNKHKILLKGEVASKTKRGLRDSQIVLEAVLKASDPPTKIVNKVRYHVSD